MPSTLNYSNIEIYAKEKFQKHKSSMSNKLIESFEAAEIAIDYAQAVIDSKVCSNDAEVCAKHAVAAISAAILTVDNVKKNVTTAKTSQAKSDEDAASLAASALREAVDEARYKDEIRDAGEALAAIVATKVAATAKIYDNILSIINNLKDNIIAIETTVEAEQTIILTQLDIIANSALKSSVETAEITLQSSLSKLQTQVRDAKQHAVNATNLREAANKLVLPKCMEEPSKSEDLASQTNSELVANYNTPAPFIKDSLWWYYINSVRGKKLIKWVKLNNTFNMSRLRCENESGQVIKYRQNIIDVLKEMDFNNLSFTKYLKKKKKIAYTLISIAGLYFIWFIYSLIAYRNILYTSQYYKTYFTIYNYIVGGMSIILIYILLNMLYRNNKHDFTTEFSKDFTKTGNNLIYGIVGTDGKHPYTLKDRENFPLNSIRSILDDPRIDDLSDKYKQLFYFNNYNYGDTENYKNLIIYLNNTKKIDNLINKSYISSVIFSIGLIIFILWSIYSGFNKYSKFIIIVFIIIILIPLWASISKNLKNPIEFDVKETLHKLKTSLSSFEYCNDDIVEITSI